MPNLFKAQHQPSTSRYYLDVLDNNKAQHIEYIQEHQGS